MIWFIIIALAIWIVWVERRVSLIVKAMKEIGAAADKEIARLQSQIDEFNATAESDRKRNHAEFVSIANTLDKLERH